MIGLIENRIIERLQAASKLKVLGYALRQVDSLPSSYMDLAEIAATITQFPSAWTVFSGLKVIQQLAGGRCKVEGSFHLVVAAQSLRSQQASRLGAPGAIGAYQLLEDASGLLVGQDLGLPITGLELRAADSQYVGKAKTGTVAMFSLSLATQWLFEPNQPGVDTAVAALGLGDFATFSVAWDVPPFGGVDADPDAPGVQLPADAKADAADLIQLPTQEPAP